MLAVREPRPSLEEVAPMPSETRSLRTVVGDPVCDAGVEPGRYSVVEQALVELVECHEMP